MSVTLSHHFEMDAQGLENAGDEADTTLYDIENTLTSTVSDTISTPMNRVVAGEKNVHNGCLTLPESKVAIYSNPATTDYAEITTVDRTMQEAQFHKLQKEIEGQMTRLQNLSSKDFLAEMEVIRENLDLTEKQMTGIALMTLREVPIKHRHCNCCHIVIRQKYSNCLFTSPWSVTKGGVDSAISFRIDHDQAEEERSSTMNGDEVSTTTPPSPSPNRRKYPRLTSLKSLFQNPQQNPLDTPTAAISPITPITPITPSEMKITSKFRPLSIFPDSPQHGATTDVDSILCESKEMEYHQFTGGMQPFTPGMQPMLSASPLILPNPATATNTHQIANGHDNAEHTVTNDTTLETSGFHLTQNGENLLMMKSEIFNVSPPVHIDINPEYREISNRETLCLCIGHRIRALFLFLIPFLWTAISAIIALVVLLEIVSESFTTNNEDCNLCRKIHEIFYGPKIHHILTGKVPLGLSLTLNTLQIL